MSEFKFYCSNCGQHIEGDRTWVGRTINCPSCQKPFVVAGYFITLQGNFIAPVE